MARKTKKQNSSKRTSESKASFGESIGLSNLFAHERVNFFIGFFLLVVAGYLTLSFVSFLTSGQADQSYVDHLQEGEMANMHGEFSNTCGSVGAYVADFFVKRCFGLPAFFIPAFLLVVALQMMKAYKLNLWKWFFAMAVSMVWLSVALAQYLSPLFADKHYNPGGDHGLAISQHVGGLIGTPGLTALLVLVALAFLIYLSAETIYIIRKLLNPIKYFSDRIDFHVVDTSKEASESSYEDQIQTVEDPEVFDNPQAQTVEFPDLGEPVVDDGFSLTNDSHADDDPEPLAPKKQKPLADPELEVAVAEEEETADGKTLVDVGGQSLEPYDPKRDLENYHYPTLDLLKKYENDGKPYIDMQEQMANKNRITEVLRSFGVEINSIKATVGPTITLYEITLAPGVRISKVRSLEDDIALSLSALGIRIIAPIPGKGTIGIEVPNAKPSIVSMESILNSKKFQESTMELPCAIGKTITNEVFMFDLAKAPHLLVAGATGQGKSVGLNAIITSLLYKKHPAELKIVLVDPKKVEFSIYAPIVNHFLAKVPEDDADPIITDVTKVVRTLNSLCKEMDTRYDLLKLAGARNIKEYNAKFISRRLNPERGHKYMPYIVVVIDEFGDLIMTAGKEIELPIARIAQLARAVGIHMIIATQRPTTTIITGNIKANFPARIAFKVSAGIDSKTILDRTGAQQLIGRGDMLFLNGAEPVRVQCAFVDTPEVEKINQFIAQQQGYLSAFELPEPDTADGELGESKDVDMTNLDPMFADAARLIVLSQSGSTSLIQRKFAIGYNRAGRLMDQLEKAGIVGAAYGGKPREVLIQDENQLNQLITSLLR